MSLGSGSWATSSDNPIERPAIRAVRDDQHEPLRAISMVKLVGYITQSLGQNVSLCLEQAAAQPGHLQSSGPIPTTSCRTTRVVGAFPDGQSALNLAATRLRHIAGTAWSTKRYLNIELLKDQQMRGAITA
jgi:hypothetical protein